MDVKYDNLVKISEDVIEKSKQKYQKYQKYLDDNFYDELKVQLINHYNAKTNVSPEVYLKIIADNLTIKKLCEVAKKGELEVEIELISDYTSKLRWMMNEKHIKEELYLTQGENVLIQAIETYDNDKTFLKHLYSCVKEQFKDEMEDTPIEKKINYFIENKEVTDRHPKYIEVVAKELDIIKYVSKNDKLLNEFIYLKYGYKHDTYFTLAEIRKILQIDEKLVIKFYKDSITILKDVIDLYLEEFQDEKILYAKKLLTK